MKFHQLFDELPTSSLRWGVVDFGKFAGKNMTLPQIILTDPHWFWSMFENDAFSERGRLAGEAADIAKKARRIRIPGKKSERWKARIYLTPKGTFSRFEVVQVKKDWCRRSSKIELTDFIDLSISYRLKGYGNQGGKRLIECFKLAVYGPGRRLTEQRCKEFFANSANFG
jgi:hypothetical protein